MSLTLEIAKKIIESAKEKAIEMKIPENIAVVDSGGNLLAFERMDGAMLVGIQIAQDKAYTAAGTGFGTGDLAKLSQPGAVAYGLAHSDNGRIIVFAGGLPIKHDNKVIGGIGVSGGLAPDDEKVAQAGLAALNK